MNPTIQQAAVIKQAAEWYQRLKDGELDEVSQREFRDWLNVPANLVELARMCLIDARLRRVFKKNARVLPENVIDFDSYATVTRPRPQPPQRRAAMSRFKIRSIALVVGIVLAVSVVTWMRLGSSDYVVMTRQGHWDKQLLDDGTVVYVGPHTKLRFHFTEETRGVALVRGEALFEVAKDPGRPFIVSTDAGTVRAVGTAFATSDRGDTVVVTVAEGKVAVTASATRNGVQHQVYATANQQVVLSSNGVSMPVPVKADRELMWVRNWYEYEGERVADIVARLNKLNGAQVIVDDPQVLRLRVNLLMFKPSQPEEFVHKVNLWYADYPGKASPNAVHLERP